MKKNFIFKMILIISIVLVSACENDPVENHDPEKPVAVVGNNQTTLVGSYFILDARESQKNSGDTLFYTWTENPTNPESVFLFGDPFYYKAVNIPGEYKYTLTVNNGIKDSEPVELIINVLPRETSEISDPVLEAKIRFMLNKQVGTLTNQDYLAIDSLRITIGSNPGNIKPLENLVGIDKCANLYYLNLSLQSVSDIEPIHNLTKLEVLYLDQNRRINDISPLSNLINLRYLDISVNPITNISPLANLRNLEVLDIIGNDVDDISVVRNFPKLKEFWASRLPIQNLDDFSNAVDLEVLFFMFSEIKDISALANCRKLIQIEISGNEISDISSLENLTDLLTLRITENKIEDIAPIKNLTKVSSLWLNDNLIQDIKPLVENTGLGNYCEVTLFNNPLNEISVNEYIPQLISRGVLVYY